MSASTPSTIPQSSIWTDAERLKVTAAVRNSVRESATCAAIGRGNLALEHACSLNYDIAAIKQGFSHGTLTGLQAVTTAIATEATDLACGENIVCGIAATAGETAIIQIDGNFFGNLLYNAGWVQ